MSSNNVMTNGGEDVTVTLSVKELKSKFSGPPLAPQTKAPKSPTRKEALKSPTSVTSPIRKTEFAVGKSNVHIQEKAPNQKGYQVTGKVTTAKPGSKVSELAKMYPHPHPVPTQQQQNINQQMYTRSNSKPEGKSAVVNGVAAASPTKYTTPTRVKTPSTPVTVVPWDKQNEIEVQESVRERISRLNSTEEVVESKPVIRAPNKLPSTTNLGAGSVAPQPSVTEMEQSEPAYDNEPEEEDEMEQGYRVENGGSYNNNYDDDDNDDGDEGGREGSNYDREDYRNSEEDADEVPNGHYENEEQEQDYGNDKNYSEPEDNTYERDDDREPSPAPEPEDDSYDRTDDRDPSPEPEADNDDHDDPPGYSDNEDDAEDN